VALVFEAGENGVEGKDASLSVRLDLTNTSPWMLSVLETPQKMGVLEVGVLQTVAQSDTWFPSIMSCDLGHVTKIITRFNAVLIRWPRSMLYPSAPDNRNDKVG
jgi:hypothetical protein